MASTGAMDAEEFIQGRTAYIRKISDKLSWSTLLPTATEERLFKEALRHVIHVVSSKEYAPAEGIYAFGLLYIHWRVILVRNGTTKFRFEADT